MSQHEGLEVGCTAVCWERTYSDKVAQPRSSWPSVVNILCAGQQHSGTYAMVLHGSERHGCHVCQVLPCLYDFASLKCKPSPVRFARFESWLPVWRSVTTHNSSRAPNVSWQQPEGKVAAFNGHWIERNQTCKYVATGNAERRRRWTNVA